MQAAFPCSKLFDHTDDGEEQSCQLSPAAALLSSALSSFADATAAILGGLVG